MYTGLEMHLDYPTLFSDEDRLVSRLPPPFLKQRYGNRQTFPKPTAKTNIPQ